MPNSTFPAVVSFADNKKPLVTARFGHADDEDFSLRMEDAIEVTEIDPNLYMSKELWLPAGARGVFGGQIIAQALRAAFYSVPEDFDVHSLHSYFILAGSPKVPVIYQVRRLRDGRSYATRYVIASQNGKVIFVCSFSFAKLDTKNVNVTHQVKMPEVPPPEEFVLERDSFKEILEEKDIAPKYREHVEERMEEILPVDYRSYTDPKNPLTKYRYFKTRGQIRDDKRLHACIIAYVSDHGFINVAVDANNIPTKDIGMLSTLDHCIWFHSAAKTDKWLLYDTHSPRTNDGRGVAFGKIFSEDGTLVATTSQEGVVRFTPKAQQELVAKL
ncbi:thioesterase-like superfamily-domain-containing protein [Sporodiniella umbellata]|nr:thioesterase-like superfamily-domain-containing protein [Sporodiniella umbellata]